MLRIDPMVQAVLDAATESAIIMAPDGAILAANNAAAQSLLLTDAASLKGKNIYDLIPVELVAGRAAKVERLLRTGRPVQFEDEFHGKTFAHSLYPTPSEEGHVAGLVVFTQDLSAFRRADENLRREKQRQIFLMESLPGFVFLLAPDLSIRYANHTFRKNFGSPRRKQCYETLKAATDACPVCPALEAIRLERTREWEWTVRAASAPDAGPTYQMYAHPMTDVDGATLVLVLGIDVTARKNAERGLEKSQRLQKAILDNIPDMAWLMDNENHFIAVNEAFTSTFSGAAKIPGCQGDHQNWELAGGLDLGLDALEIARTGERVAVEEMLASKEGGERWFETISTPLLNERGDVVVTAGIARDITERKLAVDRLLYSHAELEQRVGERTEDLENANALLHRNAEKLERAKRKALAATRAKSLFLANMSHEIRTPLNAILGMTEMALRSGASGQLQRYLQMVKAGGASLLTVINDILDFSKIEARKLVLDEIDFDLPKEIDIAVNLFSLQAWQKGLSIEYAVAPDTPRVVLGDPTRLRQILGNLVNNAVKFTPTGGVTITVADAGPAPADTPTSGRRLLFGVKDTGCGIPPEKQRLIFDSFSQADETITRQYGGTGLGLAICKELVHLMGGSITVESESGQGSAFYFTVIFKPGDPEKVRDLAPRSAAAALSKPAGPLNILVAEDNELNKELLASFLASEGHSAKLVSNGREAVEALSRERFDLVLMDGQMPEMDGITAARRIRAGLGASDAPGAQPVLAPDIPIIAMTAHAMKGDRERFLAAGMDDYLTKPVDLDKLLDLLARHGRPMPDADEQVCPAPLASNYATNYAPAEDQILELDRAGALARLMGREPLLERLNLIFVETGRADLETLGRAIASNDLEATRFQAHTLKGCAASVGAMHVAKLAMQIEYRARAGELDGLDTAYASLQEAFTTVVGLLSAHANEQPPRQY